MSVMLLENLHVEFPIYGAQRSLRKTFFMRATGGLIGPGTEKHRLVVKALDGGSRRLEGGDRLGLIGNKGGRKAMLQKVVGGFSEPTAGRVLAWEKIPSLFDVMPGLDGEDTGYKNIITAGLLLGMEREEIEAKILDI